ncbi:hypothetical protein [Homoserinibacter sp. GY 40078]|uniref:hypothetical protein n=1 Tax=Homoserinibacter sp. GY 40078 TaxID=2603275 RepID=UPI0011C8EE5A|nr:hypothetical protein [Homoserinibacter sp. GY 40078]TXK19069.1 hypothetical protein FVQ89_03865 [Homoserinibacter sp. GY 40078]
MSTPQPGRLPASVYRRRRVVVGLAALAVIAIIVLLLIPRGGDEPTTPDPTTPSGSGTPSAESTEPADAAACDPADITLTPVTDKSEYQEGEFPMISMTIVNSGTEACSFDVGTDAQLYSIVSGSDPIWNSRDCQSESAPQEMVLEPGVETNTTPFEWGRVRSGTDNCGDDRPLVTAEGATYRLSVALGQAKSEEDVPFLLY